MTAIRHLPAPTEGIEIDGVAVLQALGLNPRDPKTQALLVICDRYKLDPVLKHVVLISGNAYVTRDGYLAIAHRSGQFDGMEVLEAGENESHYTAKVAVYRKDMGRPFSYVGRYPKSGHIAKAYGPEMAVKVAEVQALRRAFNVTGISAADEMWDQQIDAGGPAALALEPGSSGGTAASAPPAAELADDEDRSALGHRVEALDDEHRAMFTARWMDEHLPPVRHPDFNKAHVAAANAMLDVIEAEATSTYDRRRKHANAKLGEAGIKGDDARHEFVRLATNGETESTKRLTQAQVDAIVAMCAEEQAAAAS